jgi:hypothetical protein
MLPQDPRLGIQTLIDKVIIHMVLIFFFLGVNPLIQRGRPPSNSEFSHEISKI